MNKLWSEGVVQQSLSVFISYLKYKKLVSKGLIFHLVRVDESNVKTVLIQLVPIESEFPGVFLDNLLGVPLPDTQSIYIPPFRITLVELKELK